MAIQRRAPRKETVGVSLGSGVYLATVISTMDSTFNGRLRVSLLKDQGNDIGADNQTYIVNYASPFFGYTPFESMGKNNTDFNDTQKSYGMWFVPPDVGVTVMCVFVDGDPGEGYWFACLPPSFANHMVPAIGGTTQVDLTDADKKKFNTKQPLPTGEINKRRNSDDPEKDAEKILKPVHPIADRFLEQGTLEDDVRGVTTSTARRQTPNSVFGILTPGPLDWRDGSKRMNVGPADNQSLTGVAVSRLGGTQFVIDDGDDRYVRDTDASQGPVKYIDVIEGRDAATGTQTNSKGRVDIPYNEHTRIRTRTGHQILLHNSEDLIYIGNAKGTAWVELTSNGKIDIYAADSISIHSENDLNIKADRDINMEAGRNINMKATAEYQSKSVLHRRDADGNPIPKIEDELGYEAGRIQIESAFNFNLLIGANGKIETRSYENAEGVIVPGDLDIDVIGNTRIEQKINLDVKTGQRTSLTAGANTEILSTGQHIETALEIHMNGPEARTADDARSIADLITHVNLYNDYNKEWSSTKYQDGAIQSIMRRVPMHEPWALHENNSPSLQTPELTDRELISGEEE